MGAISRRRRPTTPGEMLREEFLIPLGMTQKQLAELVGTAHSVISRLEDADYQGHSLRMLLRISAPLHRRIEVRFVPLARGRPVSARHKATA